MADKNQKKKGRFSKAVIVVIIIYLMAIALWGMYIQMTTEQDTSTIIAIAYAGLGSELLMLLVKKVTSARKNEEKKSLVKKIPSLAKRLVNKRILEDDSFGEDDYYDDTDYDYDEDSLTETTESDEEQNKENQN
ncbi:MAG: hypothetical protein LBM87_00675 [Ruminococcus sp.]|jgi:hypothetical protein|nr:hypothetical protein [Ruminococcus sp.]